MTRLSHTVVHLKLFESTHWGESILRYPLKMNMGTHTDEKLDNVTRVPLISNVRRTFKIQLRIHIVHKLIKY